ncbi:hypothetical protein AVEN_167252-1 [Araneus ventricosus]|uniref:Endonuclease/exonuclease/phosphatase domain-containing protein n=1 Tax=Araneus ventricosus TaxID=182803 RepID=A0A4Y2HFY0_ARAVE|nr:hypothetical protein AVEN_167252-1 [Araneus ventricosus]
MVQVQSKVAEGWRFLQANLGRSRPATGEIPTFRSGLHDIILLQEPYTVDGSLAGPPMGWRVVHAQGGKTAILVSNPELDVVELVKTVNTAGTQISDRTLSVAVFSIYFPPSSDKSELVAQLSATLKGIKSSCVLIGGDINMRHPLWGPEVKDHKSSDEGLPFVDFITKHSLTLDFAAHTWHVTTRTLSDHNYLEYNLGELDVTERIPRFNLDKFRLRKVAQKFANIESTLLDQLDRSVSPEDLDKFVSALTATIQEVCATYLKYTKRRPKTVPWWDAELETLRNKTCALKRRFSRILDPVVKADKNAEYKMCRDKFRRTLSIKRDKSWSDFCREVSSLNEFALPYKICANKVCSPLVIGNIQVDGRPCTTLRESIEQIVKVLFPSDNEVLTESREQQARRLFVESYDSSNSDPHFTKTEVWSALKQSKRRKAPGLDRLQYEIIIAINSKSLRLLVSCLTGAWTWVIFLGPGKVQSWYS